MLPTGIDVSKGALTPYMVYNGIKGCIKTLNIRNGWCVVQNIFH